VGGVGVLLFEGVDTFIDDHADQSFLFFCLILPTPCPWKLLRREFDKKTKNMN
jgi:hypothetical protein